MSELSTGHLEEIATLLRARIDEFGIEAVHLTKPSLGVVRIAVDVIKRWHEEKGEEWATQRISEVTITAEMALKLSQQGYETGYAAAKKETASQEQRLESMIQSYNMLGSNGSVSAGSTPEVAADGIVDAHGDKIDEGSAQILRDLAEQAAADLATVNAEIASAIEVGVDYSDGDDETVVYAWPPSPPLSDEAEETQRKINLGATLSPLRSPVGPGRVPEPDVARENVATMLATASGGALVQAIGGTGFDYTPTPPKRMKRPEMRGEKVAPGTHRARAGRNGNVLPTRQEMIAEVQRQAMGGVMPRMDIFDEAKPANWGGARAQINRLQVTWGELAQQAGLKPNRRVE